MKIDYSKLEKKIDYKFKNKNLLVQCLTHKSFNKMNNIFGYTQTKGIIEPSLLLPERRFLFLFKNTYLCDSFIQLLTKIWA